MAATSLRALRDTVRWALESDTASTGDAALNACLSYDTPLSRTIDLLRGLDTHPTLLAQGSLKNL